MKIIDQIAEAPTDRELLLVQAQDWIKKRSRSLIWRGSTASTFGLVSFGLGVWGAFTLDGGLSIAAYLSGVIGGALGAGLIAFGSPWSYRLLLLKERYPDIHEKAWKLYNQGWQERISKRQLSRLSRKAKSAIRSKNRVKNHKERMLAVDSSESTKAKALELRAKSQLELS